MIRLPRCDTLSMAYSRFGNTPCWWRTPINRYLINSTTQGLVYGEDGSLTITIQHEQPQDATQKANWLSAPEGPFYMFMRMYQPEEAAFHGSWQPPAVKRLD
jgi:hypothetical protein